MKPALEATPEERERQYEEAWKRGGLPFLGAFGDLLFEKAANDTIADFARRKIREIVKDPATADLLCPDNVFGCKRLCVDTDYFETYNLPHVKLVDVSKTPIERFTADGIEVDGVEYPLDAVVCATGFAAMTGSFDKIRDHRPRRPDAGREMAGGPARLSRHRIGGFSQPVHDHRPRQPSVLASMIQAIEQHVDWLADCMAHMRDVGAATIEPVRAERTPGSSTSPTSRRFRCARPAAPGMSAPTSPAGRGCSCPISAASRSMCRNATRS